MEILLQDLRYAIRMLRKNPGFTVVAVITLALGIGANTAIFSVVNSVLLRPLPFREPQQLVRVYSEFPTMKLNKFWLSPPELLDIEKDSKSWAAIGAWAPGGQNIGTGSEPLRVTSAVVTRGLIDALGVQPELGRNFSPEEDRNGGTRVALISHGLWQRAFGGESNIIGKQIQVNAQATTVIGVMPASFGFPPGSNDQVEVLLPFQFDPANPGNRGSHFLSVIGRLKPGVSVDQARTELTTLMTGWKAENRARHLLNNPNHPVVMLGLHEDVVGSARVAVLMLMGAVGFVLLIACVNVANLLLARAEARHREFAVRLALGAGLKRMIRQFIAEGLVLVCFAAVLGTLLAFAGLKLLLLFAPDSMPRTGEIHVELRVLAFTLGLSVVAVFLFALAPLAQIRERNLANWIRGAGQRAIAVGGQALRKALVVTEIALAVVLVIGSGLMIRAFWKLQQVKVGFEPAGVMSFSLQLPGSSYDNPKRWQFANTLQQRLATLPGVESAALAGGLPPLRRINANDTEIEGYQPTPDGPAQNVDYWNVVGNDYFKTMKIRTLEGRTFESMDDNDKAMPVVVVNESLAKRFWKGSPIGRRVNPGFADPKVWATIVGIVEDTKNAGMDKPAGPELYFPAGQIAQFGLSTNMNFVVRTQGDPQSVVAAVRGAVRESDPGLPVYGLRSMSEVVERSMVQPKFLSLLLAVFASIALFLAAIGIYGVMAYSVAQRTQEIGVRMALGAQRVHVLKLVFSQGFLLLVLGTAIGLGGAFALTRLMKSLLFEVTATDPLTYSSVVGILALVALLACYIPARRATKVDPLVALRYE
ncbi:MAG TPA: ABC transporter permease [Pyrinomonadaceae bacterium]|nr:ABC transporter permease [Pyrinomonadaceae bacterium]